MLCDDLGGGGGEEGRKVNEGGDICIHIADSCCGTAETNNIVKQLYSNKKIVYVLLVKNAQIFLEMSVSSSSRAV